MANGRDALKEIFTPSQYSLLFESSEDAQRQYASRILSPEQRNLFSNTYDMVRYAVVEDLFRNFDSRFNSFSDYTTRNNTRYLKMCKEWLETEEFFLEKKIHHHPNDTELISDFENRKLCQKRRAFYFLIYPEEIEFTPRHAAIAA